MELDKMVHGLKDSILPKYLFTSNLSIHLIKPNQNPSK